MRGFRLCLDVPCELHWGRGLGTRGLNASGSVRLSARGVDWWKWGDRNQGIWGSCMTWRVRIFYSGEVVGRTVMHMDDGMTYEDLWRTSRCDQLMNSAALLFGVAASASRSLEEAPSCWLYLSKEIKQKQTLTWLWTKVHWCRRLLKSSRDLQWPQSMRILWRKPWSPLFHQQKRTEGDGWVADFVEISWVVTKIASFRK